MRKHIMGDGDIMFDVVSDPSVGFSHSESFQNVNYLDENLNIRLPVFSIHGNHDDPNGKDAFSVLDILSTTGLINYFGKQVNMDKIEVSPILLTKNNVNVSLYGIGALPEERFHRYIANDRVAFLRLDDNKKKWFNIFVVHQNRVRHGTKYLPEHCLTDLPDFVVWGHEVSKRVCFPEIKVNKLIIAVHFSYSTSPRRRPNTIRSRISTSTSRAQLLLHRFALEKWVRRRSLCGFISMNLISLSD